MRLQLWNKLFMYCRYIFMEQFPKLPYIDTLKRRFELIEIGIQKRLMKNQPITRILLYPYETHFFVPIYFI